MFIRFYSEDGRTSMEVYKESADSTISFTMERDDVENNFCLYLSFEEAEELIDALKLWIGLKN